MITMNIKIDGMGILSKKMNDIIYRVPQFKKDLLHEMGSKAKLYASENIAKADAISSGHLLRGMHFRVSENSANVWNDAGIEALSWEFGMKRHYIYRNTISEGGYTVGDWMDSVGFPKNIWRFKVGHGRGSGIEFMNRAYFRLMDEMPMIVDKYARRVFA